MSSTIDLCGPSSDAKIEKRNKKRLRHNKEREERGVVPSDAKMKHNKERCFVPSTSSDTHDAKIEKRNKNLDGPSSDAKIDEEDFYFGRVILGRYPFQKSKAKHPFLQPIAETDRLKIQSDAKRELDAMEKELDAMEKREIQEIVRKTAAQNQMNDRIRSNLGKLLDHHNDLMTELNRITKYKHKVKYLHAQALILQKAIEMATKLQFLQEEETTLKDQWLNNRQLLAEVESRIAERRSTMK